MKTVLSRVSLFFVLLLLMCPQPSVAFRCGTPAFKTPLQTAATGAERRARPLQREDAPSAPGQVQPALPVGTERTFFAPDFRSMQQYTVSAVLRGVGRFCYVYVEAAAWEGRVTPRTVETLIHAFDEATPAGPRGIYPTLTAVFGVPPDVDENGRVILLLLNIRDAADVSGHYTAGFFNSADQGRGVRRHPGFRGLAIRSNVADMLYIDTLPLNLNSEEAQNVIAHELQHLIHWRHDSREAIWVDEGCADYAAFLCGYASRAHIAAFEKHSSVSLTAWPAAGGTSLPHYGAAFLWMLYLHERYGGTGTLRHIVQHAGTSMNGIAAALQEQGYDVTMTELFADWKIANYLSDYAHVNLTLSPTRVHRIRTGVSPEQPLVMSHTLPDFAAAYLVFEWEASQTAAGVTLSFSGETPAQDWRLHLIDYQHDVLSPVQEVSLSASGVGSLALSPTVTKAVLVPSLQSETPRLQPHIVRTYDYGATRFAAVTFVSSVLPNPVLPRYWDIVAIPSEPLVGLAPTVTLMQDARLYRDAQPMQPLQDGGMYRYTLALEPAIAPHTITWRVFLAGRSVGEGPLISD